MHRNIWINWMVEFGPIVTFFISLYILDPVGKNPPGFVLATGIFVILTALAVTVGCFRDKSTTLFPLIAAAAVIGFGTATVIFKNPLIFIIKDTVYNGLFGIALLVGLFYGKGWLKDLFGSLFDMEDQGWYILSLRWTIMFFILAISNEIVWRASLEWWVRYKFLATVVTTIFGAYQITLARRFRNPTASPWGMRIINLVKSK